MRDKEHILNPTEEVQITREQLVLTMERSKGVVATDSRSRAVELMSTDEGSMSDIEQALAGLDQRFNMLAGGIKSNLSGVKMAKFEEFVNGNTQVFSQTIKMDDIVGDLLKLSEIIDRYGKGIQANMIINNLLDKRTHEQIKSLFVETG